MAKTRRRLTAEQRQLIVGLHEKGEKIEYLSALFHTSVSTVSRCIEDEQPKWGRPRDLRKDKIKNDIIAFMKDRGLVRRAELFSLMEGIRGDREKWDLIGALKREGRVVSYGRGVYQLVEYQRMPRDVKQDIFEEVLDALCLLQGDIGDQAQEITNRVWALISMGAQGMGSAPTKDSKEEPKEDKKDEPSDKQKAVEAVERIHKTRTSGTSDPTTGGGFFI